MDNKLFESKIKQLELRLDKLSTKVDSSLNKIDHIIHLINLILQDTIELTRNIENNKLNL